MRKIGLMLCLSMMVAGLPAAENQNMEAFFTSLVDTAYPFGQEGLWLTKEGVSVQLMEGWIEAALPWEMSESQELEEEVELIIEHEVDPVIPVASQEEYFAGLPEDLFVTIQGDAQGVDVSTLRGYYDQALISNFDKMVRLYNYDSESMEPSPEFIDGAAFMAQDLSLEDEELKGTEGPVVLIFHTHAHEGFVGKEEFGILDVGDYLEQILEKQYGINVLHHEAVYDEGGVNGAYTRMGEDIQKVLDENPSIKIAIDMHRDGVGEDTRLVTSVDGKDVAQVMLVTGVSRSYDENGELQVIEYLPNENLDSVLALGFQMKMASDVLYPGFMRPLYLSCWRYSTYMLPRSMLLEVGAQTNTLEEAKAAMEPFAKLLVGILQRTQ